MAQITLITNAYSPPLYAEVKLLILQLNNPYDDNESGTLLGEVSGEYSFERWKFETGDIDVEAANLFRFDFGDNERARAPNPLDSDRFPHYPDFYLSEFQSWQWTRLGPVPERGQATNKDFDVPPPSERDQNPYEVIVIGSGMAGGVLAERLSDSGVRTLLLEAGGAPLETHIANLPRRNRSGFQKHIWERWFDFRVKNCDSGGSDNDYTSGFQGFNLGGRSVFWGGFIPRMTSAELDFWPRQLKWDLEDRYYQLAEEVMGRSTAPTTEYTHGVHRLLRDQLRDFTHFDAPVAVHKSTTGGNTLSTGVFSTADLLLESHRSNDFDTENNLTIRTHQLAVEVRPGSPCEVVTRDIASGETKIFRGEYVVLSCGCVESARLAKRSGLGNDLVGTGITDHPVAYTHFEIPPYRISDLENMQSDHRLSSSDFYDRYGTVKVVSQHKEPEKQAGIYNMLIELGADFNQGRYMDTDIFQESARKGSMLCEVVFLTNMELVLDNRIEFDPLNEYRPIAHVKNPGLSVELHNEIRSLRDRILRHLDGEVIINRDGNPSEGWGDGSLGFVAHEVGSLHMQVPAPQHSEDIQTSNNINSNNQQPLPGVVDFNGKFLDQDNIYACDLSIFPTSPAANPSLTAVALAIRLSDRLVSFLR